MRNHRVHLAQRKLLASILLIALAFRAAIPVGFMPAEHAFGLQICPAGLTMHHMPAGSHSSDTHPGNHEHCSYGALPGIAPTTQAVTLVSVDVIGHQLLGQFKSSQYSASLNYSHSARGPPALT